VSVFISDLVPLFALFKISLFPDKSLISPSTVTRSKGVLVPTPNLLLVLSQYKLLLLLSSVDTPPELLLTQKAKRVAVPDPVIVPPPEVEPSIMLPEESTCNA